MKTIKIANPPVALFKVLKFENIAASGGEAKHIIKEGHVKVNGRKETKKSKKIYPGDKIETGHITLLMSE